MIVPHVIRDFRFCFTAAAKLLANVLPGAYVILYIYACVIYCFAQEVSLSRIAQPTNNTSALSSCVERSLCAQNYGRQQQQPCVIVSNCKASDVLAQTSYNIDCILSPGGEWLVAAML